MDKTLIPLQSASPIMIARPTGCGKTFFTFKLLTEDMFTEKISSILYCYGVYQDYFDDMILAIPNIEFHEGIPNLEKIESLHDGNFNIIILDDLMENVICNIDTQNLFTKFCHHYLITTVFITQNIFAQGPCSRNINLSTHILILFANKCDESQIHTIGKQLFPGNKQIFIDAYKDATKEKYGYLLIDCNPSSPNQVKLQTKIFPGERTICYLNKDS